MDFDDFFSTTPAPTTTTTTLNTSNPLSFDALDDLLGGPLTTTTTTTTTILNPTTPNDHSQFTFEDDDEGFGDFQEGKEEVSQLTSQQQEQVPEQHSAFMQQQQQEEEEEEFGDFQDANFEPVVETNNKVTNNSMNSLDILSLFDSTASPISSSSSTTPTITTPTISHHHHHLTTSVSPVSPMPQVEADQQPIEFEAEFDDEFGDFVEATNSDTCIIVTMSDNNHTQQQQQPTLSTTTTTTTLQQNDDEWQVSFEHKEEEEEQVITRTFHNNRFQQLEEEEEGEPKGSLESDIFNRLVFNQRFGDAEAFLHCPKNGSLVWWERERLDVFKSSLVQELVESIQVVNQDNGRISSFLNQFNNDLNLENLNYNMRRLLFQATNWERDYKHALDTLLEEYCMVARLMLQGLREMETCARFLESIMYELQQQQQSNDGEIYVRHLLKNEKIRIFLKASVQVYAMTRLCLAELSRQSTPFSCSFCKRVIQRRLDLFVNIWKQAREQATTSYSSSTIPPLVEPHHEAKKEEDGVVLNRCCLSGRDLSNCNPLQIDRISQGLVYSPYKRFYSYRVKFVH